MKPGLAFYDAHDRLTVVLANDGIRFPVTYPATYFNNGGAIIDGKPVGYRAASFRFAVSLLSLLLAAQVLP